MKTAKEILKDIKKVVLEQIKDKLQECENEEVDFHDIIHNEIDCLTPQDKKTQIDLINLADTQYFDSGLIDNSSLDRTLITSAYCSIEQNLFNDDFIQELQTALNNNEKVSKKKANTLIKKIDEELNKMNVKIHNKPIYEDNSTQIFIKTSFSLGSLTKSDFIKYGLINKQVLDLSDRFKILTSNKTINQNAVVIEEKKRDLNKKSFLFRVYLMDKNKDLDIRNLFKLKSISEETGFNLNPSAYFEQTTEQYEEDKLTGKKNYLHIIKDKTTFLKQIVKICSDLTKSSL
jgi:hypothetical protein